MEFLLKWIRSTNSTQTKKLDRQNMAELNEIFKETEEVMYSSESGEPKAGGKHKNKGLWVQT